MAELAVSLDFIFEPVEGKEIFKQVWSELPWYQQRQD